MSSLPEAKKADVYQAGAAIMGYVDALSDIPQDVFLYACQKFRRGDAGRGFMPSSAELRQECIAIVRSLRHREPQARSLAISDSRQQNINKASQRLLKSGETRTDFVERMKRKYKFDDTNFAEGKMTEEDFMAKYPDADLGSIPDQPEPTGWKRAK